MQQDLGRAIRVVECIEELAVLVVRSGQLAPGAMLLGSADGRRTSLGAPIAPVFRSQYEHVIVSARSGMGEDIWTKAWLQGRTMPPDRALHLALDLIL
jgi:hypothetical protein